MIKFVNISKFVEGLFDDEATIAKAAKIGQPILAARLIRLTDMAANLGEQ
jgi:hypothetical protein